MIPDFVFALLVGGSIQSAITPTLSKAIEQKTQTESSLPGRLVSGVKSFLRKDHGTAETEEPSEPDKTNEGKN